MHQLAFIFLLAVVIGIAWEDLPAAVLAGLVTTMLWVLWDASKSD
jgi:hypothetical protein